MPTDVVAEMNVAPRGVWSLTTMLRASLGPALPMVTVYKTLLPTTGAGLSTVLVSERSAATAIVAAAGSDTGFWPMGVVPTAVAVFVRNPSAAMSCWRIAYVPVHVTDAPDARLVVGQDTVATRLSVTATFASADPPVFVTTYEYDTFCPTRYGPAVETDLVIPMDELSGTVTDDGAVVIGRFPGSSAVAVAVLVTKPAATSVAFTMCTPVHTTVLVDAGAGGIGAGGHTMFVADGS